MEEFGIERLPKDCIAHIISLTSPPDACRCAGVSSAFRSAAGSDAVWERFLPPDYQSLLDRSADPIDPSSSKRDLFFRLRDWVLLDGGRMGVRLEKPSRAKCFMLPARTLTIAWIGTPEYWRWIPVADSRFSEAAILIGVCWLDIRGMIQSNILSRNTTYEAFLVFKLTNWSRGFREHPQEASVALGLQSSTKLVHLVPNYSSFIPIPPIQMVRLWPNYTWFIPIPPMNGDDVVVVDDDDDRSADVDDVVVVDDDDHNADVVVNQDHNDDVDNEDDVVMDDDNDHGAGVVNDDVDSADKVDNEDVVDVVDDRSDDVVDDDDHNADAVVNNDDNDDVDNADDVVDDVVIDDDNDHGAVVVVVNDDDNDDNDDVDSADEVDNDDDYSVDGGGNDHGADDYDNNNNVDDDNDDVVNNDIHPGFDVLIRPRDDGWLEIAIGKVYNEDGEDGEMTMTFTEVKALHWKSGLVVLGIEIRPRLHYSTKHYSTKPCIGNQVSLF